MNILMSIHNNHLVQIKKGVKKYEFRKVYPKKFKMNDEWILFYSTAPVSRVIGKAKIKNILVGEVDKIWNITKNFAGIDYEFYSKYYKNSQISIAYEIEEYLEFAIPKQLKELGLVKAPQSFMYIDALY